VRLSPAKIRKLRQWAANLLTDLDIASIDHSPIGRAGAPMTDMDQADAIKASRARVTRAWSRLQDLV
jgi:hypothetical protein